MQTIQARANPRLLSKADRLFTGTLAGRIIEILQNARRAGATEVDITSNDGIVTVHDNGRGIDDFTTLLDLGSSGWDDTMEQAEDPAGVGIFCLAPRDVNINSGRQIVAITGKAWTGEPVLVETTDESVEGTRIQFKDDPWTMEAVEKHAIFSGLQVRVDGELCNRDDFVSDQAVAYPELGCRIEIRPHNNLGEWHHLWTWGYHTNYVLINFHGQVVQFYYQPTSEKLQCLVDMTGEPTGIRMMLPARTQIVENQAMVDLKAAIEKEVYRYIKRRGSHRLKYAEYLRAKELGIELPEATPTYNVGLLYERGFEPREVAKPNNFPLSKCYRLHPDLRDSEYLAANAHLLGVFGDLDSPFIPVEMSGDYDGYSWAKLPTVDHIEVSTGRVLYEDYVCWQKLIAVEQLEITAHTSDGKSFRSSMPIAVKDPPKNNKSNAYDIDVFVTPEARIRLDSSDIWYHLGGFDEEGDTYDTQYYHFEERIGLFWAEVVGPGEYLRSRLLNCLRDFNLDWQSVTIDINNLLTITRKDGGQDVFAPQI